MRGGDEDRDETDYARRTTVNLAATIMLLLYAIALGWTIIAMTDAMRLERCVASGRKDCTGVPTLPSGPVILPAR